jgi:glycosyltransferase involved in cell wall biosynthesis
MRLGNYEDVYPKPAERTRVLARFGLDPNLPTVCCAGAMRTYKGLDVAVNAVRQLNGRCQLLIAGWVHDMYDIDSLRALAADAPSVRIHAEPLSDQALADVVSAADAMLLPYTRITGSGALMTAATLGRGVVASDLPFFREMLAGRDDAGRLFPVGDAAACAQAIEQYLAVPQSVREAAARRLAADASWDEVILPVARMLRRMVGADNSTANEASA